MNELWQRLQAWLTDHHPDLDLKLRDGIDDAAITAAEAEMGMQFPTDYRESLAIHDGQNDHPDVNLWPMAMQLGSVESLLGEWRDLCKFWGDDLEERVEWLDKSRQTRQVGHPQRIPFAGSPSWDYDQLLCGSFRELLERTGDGLESGKITVEHGPHVASLKYPKGPYRYFE